MGERAKICCAFSAVISRKLTHGVKVHARLGRRFIDREEADFQDLATSESTITFAFGRPNFDDCAAALWIITPAVMSEFDADEFFFISHGYAT